MAADTQLQTAKEGAKGQWEKVRRSFLSDTDGLKPLPALLKTIGEDVVGLIQAKQNEVEQKIRDLERQVDVKNESIVELKARTAELQKDIQKHVKDQGELRQSHQKELESVNEQLNAKIAALGSLEEEHFSVCEACKALEISVKECSAEKERLLEKQAEIRKKEAELRAELVSTTKALNSEIQEWKRSALAAERERDRLQKREDILVVQNDELHDENDRLKESNAVLEAEHERQSQQLRQREKELRERADDVSRLELKLKDVVTKYQKAEVTIEQLRQELEINKEDSKDAGKRNKALTEQFMAQVETIEKLRLQAIELKVQAGLKDPSKLKQHIDHLAARLDDARALGRKQKEENNVLLQKNEDLHVALSNTERDLMLERQFNPLMRSLQGPIGTASRAVKRCASASALGHGSSTSQGHLT